MGKLRKLFSMKEVLQRQVKHPSLAMRALRAAREKAVRSRLDLKPFVYKGFRP